MSNVLQRPYTLFLKMTQWGCTRSTSHSICTMGLFSLNNCIRSRDFTPYISIPELLAYILSILSVANPYTQSHNASLYSRSTLCCCHPASCRRSWSSSSNLPNPSRNYPLLRSALAWFSGQSCGCWYNDHPIRRPKRWHLK